MYIGTQIFLLRYVLRQIIVNKGFMRTQTLYWSFPANISVSRWHAKSHQCARSYFEDVRLFVRRIHPIHQHGFDVWVESAGECVDDVCEEAAAASLSINHNKGSAQWSHYACTIINDEGRLFHCACLDSSHPTHVNLYSDLRQDRSVDKVSRGQVWKWIFVEEK
jgi:hypothetical protein